MVNSGRGGFITRPGVIISPNAIPVSLGVSRRETPENRCGVAADLGRSLAYPTFQQLAVGAGDELYFVAVNLFGKGGDFLRCVSRLASSIGRPVSGQEPRFGVEVKENGGEALMVAGFVDLGAQGQGVLE